MNLDILRLELIITGIFIVIYYLFTFNRDKTITFAFATFALLCQLALLLYILQRFSLPIWLINLDTICPCLDYCSQTDLLSTLLPPILLSTLYSAHDFISSIWQAFLGFLKQVFILKEKLDKFFSKLR